MKKPVVGITPDYMIGEGEIRMPMEYVHSLMSAGVVPVILPLTEEEQALRQVLAQCDGVLFSGGQDLSPALYGEDTLRFCGDTHPLRDRCEQAIFSYVMEEDIPVLGVCRGLQFLNVALGGSLYQDIDGQYGDKTILKHTQKGNYTVPCHGVELVDGMLTGITGARSFPVNSIHHQAIKVLGNGLVAEGYAADGLIEAVSLPEKKFFAAVQWHPEYLSETDGPHRRLFFAFAEACRNVCG